MIHESEFEKLMRVHEDQREIHLRLMNWAAWSRDRARQGHCRSVEWHYTPPRIKEAEDLHAVAPPDGLDAARLHSEICMLPLKLRWLLHLWYIHKARPQFIRRKLGLTRDGLPDEIRRARFMLTNRMRRG